MTELSGLQTYTRAISPAISTVLLITVALGAVAAAAAYTYRSGQVAAREIEIVIDDVNFSRARTGANTWLFSMNIHNTGTVPVTVSGTVTGTSVGQSFTNYNGMLNPGAKDNVAYVWAVNPVPGEKYIVSFVATGADGSTKRYTTFVIADG